MWLFAPSAKNFDYASIYAYVTLIKLFNAKYIYSAPWSVAEITSVLYCCMSISSQYLMKHNIWFVVLSEQELIKLFQFNYIYVKHIWHFCLRILIHTADYIGHA